MSSKANSGRLGHDVMGVSIECMPQMKRLTVKNGDIIAMLLE